MYNNTSSGNRLSSQRKNSAKMVIVVTLYPWIFPHLPSKPMTDVHSRPASQSHENYTEETSPRIIFEKIHHLMSFVKITWWLSRSPCYRQLLERGNILAEYNSNFVKYSLNLTARALDKKLPFSNFDSWLWKLKEESPPAALSGSLQIFTTFVKITRQRHVSWRAVKLIIEYFTSSCYIIFENFKLS